LATRIVLKVWWSGSTGGGSGCCSYSNRTWPPVMGLPSRLGGSPLKPNLLVVLLRLTTMT
jgi:hypothetical protein